MPILEDPALLLLSLRSSSETSSSQGDVASVSEHVPTKDIEHSLSSPVPVPTSESEQPSDPDAELSVSQRARQQVIGLWRRARGLTAPSSLNSRTPCLSSLHPLAEVVQVAHLPAFGEQDSSSTAPSSATPAIIDTHPLSPSQTVLDLDAERR